MKKLRQKYKVEKDKTRKSGSGQCKKWKFFDQMDQLLSNRLNVTPVVVLDPMATENQWTEGSKSSNNEFGDAGMNISKSTQLVNYQLLKNYAYSLHHGYAGLGISQVLQCW